MSPAVEHRRVRREAPDRRPAVLVRPSRRGLTLMELLAASTILGLVAVSLAALGEAVQSGWEHSQGRALAAQHARVIIERIGRAVRTAHVAEDHPGFAVVFDSVGGYDFPDTLIVWQPAGPPANEAGPPLVRECVLFCPDPASPNRLVELTNPTDGNPLPLDGSLNSSAGRAQIQAIKTSSTTRKVVLTGLLRVASSSAVSGSPPPLTLVYPGPADEFIGGPTLGGNLAGLRGVLRFEQRVRPSADEWSAYRSGTLAWTDLPWVQGISGSQTGLRQAWLAFEFHLEPGWQALAADPAGRLAIPFFGTAAAYSELHR